MRVLRILLVAIAIVAIGLIATYCYQHPKVNLIQVRIPETIQVKGRVVDAAGHPVVGAKVFAITEVPSKKYPGGLAGSATTGKQGIYRLVIPARTGADLAMWPAYIVAVKPGIGIGRNDDLDRCTMLPESVQNQEFVIALKEPVDYTGQVTDIHGKPLSGVKVRPMRLLGTSWLNYESQWPKELQFAPVISGADGSFTIKGLPRDLNPVLRAETPGYIQKSDVKNQVVMAKLGSEYVAGRVLTPDRKPVPGLRVWLDYSDRDYISAMDCVLTAADGSYRLRVPGPGEYQVQVESTRCCYVWSSGLSSSVRVSENGSAKLDLSAEKIVPIGGRLVDADSGKPIPGGEVLVSGRDSHFIGTEVTDAHGKFSAWVEPDEARIEYRRGNPLYCVWRPVQKKVTSDEDRFDDVELRVKRCPIGEGRVVGPDGRPVKGVLVSIGSLAARAVTGRDGRFRIAIPSRKSSWYDTYPTVPVKALAGDKRYGAFASVSLRSLLTGDAVLKLQQGRVLRVVVKAKNGDPVAGTNVSMEENANGIQYFWHWRETDSRGRAVFLFRFFPSADYRLGCNSQELKLPRVGSRRWKDEITFILDK